MSPRGQTETQGSFDLAFAFGAFECESAARTLVIPVRLRSNCPGTTTPGDEREPEVQGNAISNADVPRGG
jgi:hypothetical protein